ncbi:hypothetical protein ACE41H_15205 [Paenibacillus enshidis]|uniref:Uncharacterized protein n=1 Tax=Paenibacillus enshidis TaxID=1458439 RepID=A0ABV5AW43_9BACL
MDNKAENTRHHECDQIINFNKKYRENKPSSYAKPEDDKVYIMKDSIGPWELCFSYPVDEYDCEDVDSVEILHCPYCGEKLI